ncbi:MAG: kynureninase [Gammaproteobacteria bacterium]|nr:kynureninase [Gammaproteobacteria bacterium]
MKAQRTTAGAALPRTPTTHAAHAAALDADDELAPLRREFELPSDGRRRLTYLCGHSLGLMPRRARSDVRAELDRWGRRAVEGHFSGDGGWFAYHQRFSAPLARLVGAAPEEVVAMNTLTANLHLMLVSFYRPTAERYKILIERDAFPSDRYAVQSQIRFHGRDPRDALLELAPEPGSWMLDVARLEALLAAEGERIALLLLPGVQYLSGQALDIGRITSLAHRHGCVVGFDLAHSIGNVPLALARDGADFAVWCSYKYLNAGPGAVAGAFVHRKWHGSDLPRFEGWWGHAAERRFAAERAFSPMPGAEAWQLSNPPILSLAPLAASLELFERAGLERLRAKSERLTGYLELLLRETLGERCEILTPAAPSQRGCQLSVRLQTAVAHFDGADRDGQDEPARHDGPRGTAEALRTAGIVADWRGDVLRLAPVPLYNRFRDVLAAVRALRRVLE